MILGWFLGMLVGMALSVGSTFAFGITDPGFAFLLGMALGFGCSTAGAIIGAGREF